MPNPQDELEALRAQMASLTARIHRLEQSAGIEPQISAPTPPPPPIAKSPAEEARIKILREDAERGPVPPPPPMPHIPPRQNVAVPRFAQTPQRSSESLEGTIGKLWLNRIGIVAILIGVAYFLKYAFDSGWIGPGGRVAIGLIAGMAVVVWSESFRRKGSAAFSYSLKAVGIGILYLSLWAASQYFHLVPASVAFVAMILVGFHHYSGSHPGCRDPGCLRHDWRLQHARAGFHRTEPRDHFVLLCAAARPGHTCHGGIQTMAAHCVGRHAGNRDHVCGLGCTIL